jgi:hypothetical protein
MDESIAKELDKEEQSEFHKTILSDSRALVTMSRRKMQSFYSKWDNNDKIFRSIRPRDKEDVKARERDEPEKMVVPIAFSQAQTFVAFCYSLFTQRDRIFELEGHTSEDERPAQVGEALLAQNLRYNKFESLLDLFLRDIARFGLGVMKIMWHTEIQTIREQQTTPGSSFLGVRMVKPITKTIEREAVKYQGNKLTHISPYRFFPDTRLPLIRFQEGEFCASEDLYSMSQLKQWEHEGLVSGTEFIKPLGKDKDLEHFRGYGGDDESLGAFSPGSGMRGDGQVKKTVLVTEIQREIVPSSYLVNDIPLGPEDYPVKYVIWLANNQRVIKCEPLGYLHNQFTYIAAPFIFDDNVYVGDGLMDTIGTLSDVITWFINTRITNVRKIISDKLVVQPKNINMDDLDKRSPVIRLTSSAIGDISRSIMQLPLQDVTSNHISDAKFLHEIVQIVTGINDTVLGQFQPGRRSATEHRNVTSGSAARLKACASVIYWVGLEPMAQQMISNLQDGLDEEQFVKLLGLSEAQAGAKFIGVTKDDLVGSYEFNAFDGTLPSERSNAASALEEVLQMLLTNPNAAVLFGLDPKKLLREIMIFRGVKNPERFNLDNATQSSLISAIRGGVNPSGSSDSGGESILPLPGAGGEGGGVQAATGGVGG